MLKSAVSHLPWAIAHRRYLHQYPELSNEEKNTAEYCKNILQDLGYSIKDIWGYGFIADLNLNKKKTIAWRADMDALCMGEKNNHSFVSKYTNVAHMCGHDVHMAISLLAAKLMIEYRDKIPCNVRFIFQPAEEKSPGGALFMVQNGCLENVCEVYGLHNDITKKPGEIAIRLGTMTSAISMFKLTIKGRGGHSATPHKSLDPLSAIIHLINCWNSSIFQKTNPFNPVILCPTQIHGGMAHNIIPEEAFLGGSVRAVNAKDLNIVKKNMLKSLEDLKRRKFEYKFDFIKGYDATVNKAFGVQRIKNASKALNLKINTNVSPVIHGEDFGYYLLKKPGAFFYMGSMSKKTDFHSPYFDVNEDVIAIGATMVLQLMLQTR